MTHSLHGFLERILWTGECAISRCRALYNLVAAPGSRKHALDMTLAEERVLFSAVPVADLLISTDGTVTGGGAPGDDTWNASDVQQVGDPNLDYGNSTNGTFSNLFRLDNFSDDASNIDALHYVSTDITVGGGANTFDLKAGDILFSTTTNENLTSTNTLNGYGQDDVLVFRADTAGDYSSGTFHVLLEDLPGTNTKGITLVEKTTFVGGSFVNAGTFLFLRDGASQLNDVYHFTADTVGVGATAGTTSLFVDGTDISIETQLHGLEFIEQAGSYGGEFLSSGTLLLVGEELEVGNNEFALDTFDIYELDLTQTGATTAGNASLFFDASDVSLNSAAENIRGFTLVTNDSPPVLDLDADNSTSTGANFAATFTEDGGPVSIVDTDAILSDATSTNLTRLTVDITNRLDGNDETLSANTSGTSISASYFAGRLTLSGTDTVANYQQVLRTITYNNTSQDPNTTARTITFVANDGTSDSNVGTTTVTVVAQDDAPVIDLDPNDITTTGANYAATFTEDGGEVRVASSLGVFLTDVDSGTLSSLTVTITNLLDGSAESLTANTILTSISASYDSATGVLTLSGSDSLSNYDQVLKSIRYNNTSQNLDTTTRSITFVANDGAANSNVATTTLTMVAQNDAPVLDLDADNSTAPLDNFATTFTDGGGPVLVADSDATLSDIDSANLSSLTVSITNQQDGAAEVLSANTSGTSIVASYDSATGVLTLSGSDTVANYQQVLRTVTYDNTSPNPTLVTRNLNFTANDGATSSNIASTTLTMAAGASAPAIDLDANDSAAVGVDFAATFTEDGGPVLVADTDATLSDSDSVNLSSLTVTISNLLDGTAESLSANTSGTSIAASYDSATGVLTLSGSDIVANYQQVLRTVTYNNSSEDPNTTTRAIKFVASDGTNTGNIGTTNLTIVAQTDGAVLDLDANNSAATGADFAATFTEDGGAVLVADSDATITDGDSSNLNSLTVTITNLLDGTAESLSANTSGTSIAASYDSATGVLTLSGSDSVANYQQVLRTVAYNNTSQNPNTTARAITFLANDGDVDSNVGTTTVTLIAQNDAPVAQGDALTVTAGTPLTFSASSLLGNDTDVDSTTLTVVLAGQPAHGTLVANGNGTFTYTPGQLFVGTDSFSYRASDGGELSQVVTVTLSVEGSIVVPPAAQQLLATETTESREQADQTTNATGEESVLVDEAQAMENAGLVNQISDRPRQFSDFAKKILNNDDNLEANLLLQAEELAETAGTETGSAGESGGDRGIDGQQRQLHRPSLIQSHVLVTAAELDFDNNLFWEELDTLHDTAPDAELTFETAIVGTTATVMTALSVGYVMWTLKGGYLVASALSSAPLWRMIDPLPVLHELPTGRRGEGKGNGSDGDESLQSMVENAHQDESAIAV